MENTRRYSAELADGPIYSTCDVEIDLDLLVSGGARDPSVPLGALVRLHAAVPLPAGELPGARGKA